MAKLQIKQAALKLFAVKGYEATTMKEIAKEVGIKAPSIYAHYNNKETIFLEILDELMRDMEWENINIDELSKDFNFSIRNKLFDVFWGYYHYFSKNKYQLLFWQRIRYFPPTKLKGIYDLNILLYNKPILTVYIELFQYGIIKSQVREDRVEILAMSFFTFVSGYVDSLLVVQAPMSEEDLRLAFEFFWRCIRAE